MKDNLPNIWHQHDGKGMPVYLDRENFEVRFRDGSTALNHRENWSWSYYPAQPYSGADVVAWRYIVGSMAKEVDELMSVAMNTAVSEHEMEQRLSKYQRLIKGKDIDGHVASVAVDVYDVLTAWGVTNPALQHLIKKALQPGARGHKSLEADLKDIIASAQRALELEQAKGE